MNNFIGGMCFGFIAGFVVGGIYMGIQFEATKTEDVVAAAISCESLGGLKHIQTAAKVHATCNNGVNVEFNSVVEEN